MAVADNDNQMPPTCIVVAISAELDGTSCRQKTPVCSPVCVYDKQPGGRRRHNNRIQDHHSSISTSYSLLSFEKKLLFSVSCCLLHVFIFELIIVICRVVLIFKLICRSNREQTSGKERHPLAHVIFKLLTFAHLKFPTLL